MEMIRESCLLTTMNYYIKFKTHFPSNFRYCLQMQEFVLRHCIRCIRLQKFQMGCRAYRADFVHRFRDSPLRVEIGTGPTRTATN